MKDEISASCENSAPQGLGAGLPLAFETLQKFHGMHLVETKHQFFCLEVLISPLHGDSSCYQKPRRRSRAGKCPGHSWAWTEVKAAALFAFLLFPPTQLPLA